jgi:hypothetical protein
LGRDDAETMAASLRLPIARRNEFSTAVSV